MRRKKEDTLWTASHVVMYYDIEGDYPVAMFESIKEIVLYKFKEYNNKNYSIVANDLYNALRRPTHYTEMLGRPMTVYLIDTNFEEE